MSAHPIIPTLRRWAAGNAINRAKLETWRDQAIEKLGDSSGQTIGTASGHGISFTAAGGLTWDQWAAALDHVLLSLDRNVAVTSRALGAVRHMTGSGGSAD